MRVCSGFPLSTLSASLGLLALLLTAPHAARAQMPLFSNLDATPDPAYGTTIGANTGIGNQKAVAFTTGNTAYTLDSVQAYLSLNNTGTSFVSFDLYTPSTLGGDDPGTLAVSLGFQSVSNFLGSYQVYTFTPSSAFVLNANTRYVLLADSAYGDDGYWYGTTPDTLPTARNGSGFSNPVYRISNDNGATYYASTVLNSFALNGSAAAAAAPEPGTLPLVGMGLVTSAGMAGTVRRRKAKRNIELAA